jgi:hypothetical protein
MSEADIPNNQPLPEPLAAGDDSTVELPDAIGTPGNPQIINLPELPSFEAAVEQSRPGRAITPLSLPAASIPSMGDDEATEPLESLQREHSKDADWFALAQKMRQRNRRLLDQVTQLRQSLREKQEELHTELVRSRDRETLLAQQTEEFNTVQEQLTRMFNALESSHQASQRQQILIETLSEQLQSSQERVAQLERECALTQQRYNEQSHQLLQAANTCRELRTRLHRQQRQALQFKAALEKSLEMPSGNSSSQQQPHPRSNAAQPVVPKALPIQPWSAEPELIEDTANLDPIWNRPIRLEPLKPYSSETEPLTIKRIEELEPFSATGTSNPVEAAVASFQESEAKELELEQQLLAEMSSLAEASGLSENLQSDLALPQTPLISASGTNSDDSSSAARHLSSVKAIASPENREIEIPNEEFWADDLRQEPDSPEVRLPQSNWPSPVLYPLRPPKKRQSLASIDLPSFPRYRPI